MRLARRFGFPPILQIEPTNMCNLRCLTCATGSKMMKRPGVLMPFETFRSIIDQVKDYVYFLAFWSWGEPFLHKDAFRMIRYARDQGIIVHCSTNGHFFDTRERARQVIESGLDSLIVAVDGLDQQTYVKYRKGGELNRVIKSIENLVAERSSAGVKHPLITFRFIVMKHNEQQLDQVRDFAEGLGVDVLTFRSAVVQRSEVNLEDKLAPSLVKFQQHESEGSPAGENRAKRCRFICNRPYANLTIFSNGDVVSCENDFDSVMPLGNVSDKSLHEIISSERSRSFLEKFHRDLDQMPFCRSCEMRDMKYHTANVDTCILNREFYESRFKD
ncbi:MAG: radical SAM protein [Planctomycetota bacterium]